MASNGPAPSERAGSSPNLALAAAGLRQADIFTRIYTTATSKDLQDAVDNMPELQNTFMLVWGNHIIVFDKGPDNHYEHVTAVLNVIRPTDQQCNSELSVGPVATDEQSTNWSCVVGVSSLREACGKIDVLDDSAITNFLRDQIIEADTLAIESFLKV